MGLQFKNFQTLDEALKTNSTNTYPYVIVVGDPTSASSSVAVCDKRVITSEIGHFTFSAVLTLLAIHYAYNLQYNPIILQVMEFLQEKIVGDCLPSNKRLSVAFTNLSRAIGCIEQKLCENYGNSEEESEDLSVDATQAYCDCPGSKEDPDNRLPDTETVDN